MSIYRLLGTGLVVLLLTAGCRTGREVDMTKPLQEGKMVDFVPVNNLAQLKLDTGAYANLYTADSQAFWVNPPSMAGEPVLQQGDGANATSTAQRLGQNPNLYVFECHLASLFPDMSIAYDVVGLRGIYVYLLLPDGQRVPPAQTVVGGELEEEAQDALRRFGRHNVLIFPRVPVRVSMPGQGDPAGTVRLVFEGFESTYYFEWYPYLPPAAGQPVMMREKTVKGTKSLYQGTKEKVKAVSHTLD